MNGVPPEKQEAVRQAEKERQQLSAKKDRAHGALQETKRELDLAHREVEAAELRKDAQEKLLEAEKLTGQPASVQQVEAQLRAADRALEVAQARVRWRQVKVDAAVALRECHDKELQHADAELDYARYRVLKESGDTRVHAYTDEEFVSKSSDAKSEADDACRESAARTKDEREALAQWEELRGPLQARGGLVSPPVGASGTPQLRGPAR
ncbi:putative lipoprotein [Hyalangium minutum]|uniref:Putative lipoprotein n=1 Tax=Hyalangium minutum TaxID=394096 RepID=A0A085W998_9BACT|nr:putative lipoprotein [Hyalangium minutum]